MREKIYVHIPEPCNENWEAMTPLEQGKFCDACSKKVIDFSGMTDNQILEVLSKSAGKTCGRFTSQQLARPIVKETAFFVKPRKYLFSAFLPALVLSRFPACSVEVKGKPEVHARDTGDSFVTGDTVSVPMGVVLYEPLHEPEQHTAANKPVQELLQDSRLGEAIVTTGEDFEEKVGAIAVVRENCGAVDSQVLASTGNFTIGGVVLDENEQPLSYASVRLGTNVGAIADSLGRFSLRVEDNETEVNVTASYIGYTSLTRKFTINESSIQEVRFRLVRATVLENVTVTSYPISDLTGVAGGVSVVKPVTVLDTTRRFVQKAFRNEMFKVYPNPVTRSGLVNAVFKKSGDYTVQLFDNAGRLYLVKHLKVEDSKQLFSFPVPATVSSGIYFLKATENSTNNHFVDKLVIR